MTSSPSSKLNLALLLSLLAFVLIELPVAHSDVFETSSELLTVISNFIKNQKSAEGEATDEGIIQKSYAILCELNGKTAKAKNEKTKKNESNFCDKLKNEKNILEFIKSEQEPIVKSVKEFKLHPEFYKNLPKIANLEIFNKVNKEKFEEFGKTLKNVMINFQKVITKDESMLQVIESGDQSDQQKQNAPRRLRRRLSLYNIIREKHDFTVEKILLYVAMTLLSVGFGTDMSFRLSSELKLPKDERNMAETGFIFISLFVCCICLIAALVRFIRLWLHLRD